MTIRPRAVRALRDARVRLRDVAAASHAMSTAASELSRDELAQEEDRLEDFLDEATDVLGRARSIYDVDQVDEITGVYRLSVIDANHRHQQAVAAAELTATKLRERAKQLRQAECLVERVEHELVCRDARAEQRANDDMSARRR